MTRIFLCAGESSGDTHGANLIRALKSADPTLRCAGVGGQAMKAAGMELHHDLAAEAIMGFTEVLRSFPKIRELFYETVDRIEAWRPDAVVLIDYPGFNLRLAERVHALGIPVVYYISPQVWAWKKGRIKKIKRCVDKMLVILPFEEQFYRKAGVDAVYVGHPLLDHLAASPPEGKLDGGLVIGLMPGSRAQEIARIYPVMLDAAEGIREAHPEARFITPCVDPEREAQVRRIASERSLRIETVVGEMHELLHAARFCIVASGTATVQTALFGVPMVVLYRVSPLTYLLARMVVRVQSIAMVNILADKPFVPEFIQGRASREIMLPTMLQLIDDTPERQAMIHGLDAVRGRLGTGGASANAAREILSLIGQRSHG